MAAIQERSQDPISVNTVNTEEMSPTNGNSAKLTNGSTINPVATTKNQQPTKVPKSERGVVASENLSRAELKKRAKDEKIARRAQEKQEKPQAILPDLKAPRKVENLEEVGQRGSAGLVPGTPTVKSQHKATGSIQKGIPLRQAQPTTTQTVQPKKDNKNVALFGHLYNQTRRTTIAAAGKDVHPAILALGLQMSNYVICGSNARCVATLLAFKRVQSSLIL